MAALSIRDLDDTVKERLRVLAARHGRSMEAEVRAILADAVRVRPEPDNLLLALRKRFGALGGVELVLPSRDGTSRPAPFSE